MSIALQNFGQLFRRFFPKFKNENGINIVKKAKKNGLSVTKIHDSRSSFASTRAKSNSCTILLERNKQKKKCTKLGCACIYWKIDLLHLILQRVYTAEYKLANRYVGMFILIVYIRDKKYSVCFDPKYFISIRINHCFSHFTFRFIFYFFVFCSLSFC